MGKKELSSKNYVITGASGGIGTELVELLVEEGANLILIDSDNTSLKILEKKYVDNKITCFNYNFENKKDYTELLLSINKPINGFIHLAGILESDRDALDKNTIWERSIQHNLTNGYNLIEALLPKFDKTDITVMLSKFMEERYISRSQARRICLGLEKFKSVVLDFKNISTIGHGFVDEIFRVFQLKYPKIKITFTNTNDDVQFMINNSLSQE